MYRNLALVPLSCDHFWITEDFATYLEVLHKNMYGLHLFPYYFLNAWERKMMLFCLSFFFFFSWNGDRKELNQNFVLNSSIPNSCGCMCFEPGPGRTRIFSSFLLGYTCSFPFLCFVGSFWYPSLSCLHPDPSLPWVWVTRAIRLPASTYSVPQLLG